MLWELKKKKEKKNAGTDIVIKYKNIGNKFSR